jgi:hypothetical protein
MEKGDSILELTETERLMLVEKKEEIRKLTTEILDLASKPKNDLEIKKKFTNILSLLNTIASYSDSKNMYLDKFTEVVNYLFALMKLEESGGLWAASPLLIETVCNYANSARFNFTRRDVTIHMPKIDISALKIELGNLRKKMN